MSDHIDEFESMFRRASRAPFSYAEIPIHSVTLVHDGTESEATSTFDELRQAFPRLDAVNIWRSLGRAEHSDVVELLKRLDEQQTDLVVARRHVGEGQLIPQHSLGVYLDVLTQQTSIPVLVLPGTAAAPLPVAGGNSCSRVMVVTDHITGENRLINYGVRLCSHDGDAWLCHIEDDRVFQRYMETIERIPEIDSDKARLLIDQQLMQDASRFISTCIDALQQNGPPLRLHSFVERGHHLRVFRELIDSASIELLVMNTKDSDQLAMHGKAYSISVEFVDVAMLLL